MINEANMSSRPFGKRKLQQQQQPITTTTTAKTHTQQHYKICSLMANMCYGLLPCPMGQPWSSFGGLHLTQ
jgi:hypothetical protein